MWSYYVLILLYCSVVFGGLHRHFDIANEQNAANNLARAKRADQQYTIEVVVAVGQDMVDYYGNELDDVVMAGMAHTSNVYENSNLKQSIQVSLADVIRLPIDPTEGADMPGTNGKNANTILVNFCNYMKNSSYKYDASIFMTRSKIYNTDNPPSVLQGISNEKAMCRRDACLVLEDSFISVGWVAAHELGHSYGAWHEEDSPCSKFPKFDGKNIMTAVVGQSWNFSACTQSFLDDFLNDDQSKCLLTQESSNKLSSYTRNEKLFSIPRQCKEYLQDSYNTEEPWNSIDDCSTMWCLRKDGKTQTSGAPWVDGSPCGDKKCQHAKCV